MIYEITYKGTPVGNAEVAPEGLYYRINCRCSLLSKKRYHIVIKQINEDLDLGICVPSGGFYTLTKRIPQKKMNIDKIHFYVIEKDFHKGRVCIEEGQPFHQIDKLENAHSEFREGKLYLCFPTDRQ